MKRFKTAKVNWKYLIGEVLLIFIGINLAIWFNNWNTSRTRDANKLIAIEKIEDEIRNNLEELNGSRENNSRIKDAIEAYKKLHISGIGTVASPEEMNTFQKAFPGFFEIKDSSSHKTDKLIYTGDNYINLELPELSQIAWETSKVTGITAAFGYECLYLLEGMYNTQELVKTETAKAAMALQEGQIDRLLRILETSAQLGRQLENNYQNALNTIGVCK